MESKKLYNIVKNDSIWKDHVRHERVAQSRFQGNWGFAPEIYKELQQSSASYAKAKEMEKANSKQRSQKSDSETKKAFPETTTQMIGWKAPPDARHAFGIAESRARKKCDILAVFRWPQEAL